MKIVVLDRDGVINQDSEFYIKSPDEWVPIEGSLKGIANLTNAGYTVVIATNQSGLGRKLFSVEDLSSIHDKLITMVEGAHGKIHGIFYCPHLPEDHCNCRKPRTGLLEQIENRFGVSLTSAPFIGDSVKDIQAALSYGCKAILVHTGNGKESASKLSEQGIVDYQSFSNLAEAAESIVLGENV